MSTTTFFNLESSILKNIIGWSKMMFVTIFGLGKDMRKASMTWKQPY